MPTIKDIAKEAGVSHGTASNVLNGKGNVSVKKIQLVEEAARKLGYKINNKAKSLRSGSTNAVSIIVPDIESSEYAQMYQGLDKTLTDLGYRTHLYITYDLPHNEKSIIREIAEERVTGIITVSCLDDADEYYGEMSISKEHIIFVNRRVRHAEKFISFDFKQAGSDIGEFLTANGYTSVGIFADNAKYSNEKQFVDSIAASAKGIEIKVKHVPLRQSYSTAFEFFDKEPPEILITSSQRRASLLRRAHYWSSLQAPPPILSLGAAPYEYTDQVIMYYQNYHLFGHEIANSLIEQVNGRKKMRKQTVFANNGLVNQRQTEPPTGQNTVTMLTIPSPTTDALKKLLPHFTKSTGIRVRLAIKTYEEIYQILSDRTNDIHYDIIRMDMAWLSWFGKDVFRPLHDIDPQLDKLIQSQPQHMREHYSQIEGIPYAIPFDPSVQMLFYRKDLFEDPKIKRMYYEAFKTQLHVPTDFTVYNQVAQFFSQSHFKYSPTIYGTSVTLGKSEIVAAEFLTRYYAENGRLIDEQGIHLHPETAARALSNYLETVSVAQQLDANWWGEAVNSFARGETAMVIGFMNHVSRIAHSEFGSFIGWAPVPGGCPLLGGGVIGISKHTAKMEEAVSFLHWVNTLEVSEQISLLGGTSANPDVCNNQTIRTLYPWLNDALKMNENGVRSTKFADGRGLNTKKLEQIIGLSIENTLTDIMGVEQTIEQLNKQLSRFSSEMRNPAL